ALAVARHSGGKKVPVALQRMRAEDLLGAVFPAQLMCQDNQVGPIVIPDHPLVNETLHDCLHEAMDLTGLQEVIEKIGREEIRTVAVDTPVPSAMAHEILNANPYAFLDDAPLEERRARAVSLRRVDPWMDGELGRLDVAAIEEVCDQAWPDVRDADELHDFMLSVGLLPVGEEPDWADWARQLIDAGRTTRLSWVIEPAGETHQAYIAAERLALVRLVLPGAVAEPELRLPEWLKEIPASAEEATRKIIHGWIEALGPTTASQLSRRLGIPASKIETALLALESDGVVLRGQFTVLRGEEIEWCDRVLLSRIHRLTLGRMRKEIEPVSAADFMKFLLAWQHVTFDNQLRGRDGVLEVVRQLQGLELPAPAWEQHILPARIKDYDPAHLEELCLAGVITWGRLRLNDDPQGAQTGERILKRRKRRWLVPTRTAPIAFLLRDELEFFLEGAIPGWEEAAGLSPAAREVGQYLAHRGASFLADIARGTGLLKVKAEEALWQLVAQGFATGDGIAGLRILLTPETKRKGRRRRLRVISGGRTAERMMPVGRWSLWREQENATTVDAEKTVEHRAWQLLRRYGVMFRDLLGRESYAPSWRRLVSVYRRLEARGEIRGGRFVNGFVGEQFALPEAIEQLRAERRSKDRAEPTMISSADPLNLAGILTPGARISRYSNQVIVYQNGAPVDVGLLGAVISRRQPKDVKTGE
ncbi:MAG: DEAD/DEAH box helicase, partial [Candidatus Binatia bacterium]